MILTAASFFPEKLNSLLKSLKPFQWLKSSTYLRSFIFKDQIMANNLYPKPSKKVGGFLAPQKGKVEKIHFPQQPLLPRGTRAFRRSRWKGWRGCLRPLSGEQRWEGGSSQCLDDLYPKQLEEWTLKMTDQCHPYIDWYIYLHLF